ncbi:MAG: FixH family protein [Reichenbachiella sp.]
MNWGHKITITFILFAAFLAALVTVCVRQDFFLVAPDYYEEELTYQDQIDRKNNYNALSEKPSISVSADNVQVSFPSSIKDPEGKVKFFRASHAGLDREFEIQLNENNIQSFPLTEFVGGKWTVKLLWSIGDTSYYVEQTIIL